MTDTSPAIQTVDLSKKFGRRRSLRPPFRRGPEKVALDRINLTIQTGEVFGLLGPNGAGKTTLVKILATLMLPTRGKAIVDGLDVVKDGRDVRRRVGMVYGDERTFFWRLSVLENLRFYAALYQIPRKAADQRIRDLLEFVGLARDTHVEMHHFSTGMKQRAAIARGLLHDPEILFMDEPTRGLDPLAALELREFLRERVANGRRTVLVATHIMAEAEDLCHRVAFINHGQIQLIGSIEQLRSALRAEDAHVLVVSQVDRLLLDALPHVTGVHAVSITPLQPATYRLEVTSERGTAAIPSIIREVVRHGGDVWSSVPQELTLEEMFAIAARERSSTDPANGVAAMAGSVPALASVEMEEGVR